MSSATEWSQVVEGVPSRGAYARLAQTQIAQFFERTGIEREECDRRAAAELGGQPEVRPTATQGSTSYTVTARDCPAVIQFRSPDSPLDLSVMKLARETYGGLVAKCERASDLRCTRPGHQRDVLRVYVMGRVPGEAFANAQRELYSDRDDKRMVSIVQDFARFVASALRRPVARSPEELRAARDEAERRLQGIAEENEEALPATLGARLDEVRARLPTLFGEAHPQVLNHGDLLEHNIHVSIVDGRGRVEGVVDWAGARVGPFGTSLYGLETLLGFLSPQNRWARHARDGSLREAFREAFYEEAAGCGGSFVVREELLADVRAARALAVFMMFSPGQQQDAESREAGLAMLEGYLHAEAL